MPRNIKTLQLLVSVIFVFSIFARVVGQSCSVPAFTQPPTYEVGSDVRGMATADFDSDGKADIAIVDVNSDSVTVFSKLAQGTAPVTNSYSVGRFPLAVVAADFNADGKPDLVVGNNSSGDLSVLLNDGTGHFLPTSSVPIAFGVSSIVVADFNGDSKLDLAMTAGTIFVTLGDGHGGFGLPRQVPIGQQISKIIAADFSGDSNVDLAVTTVGVVRILNGDGTGNFTLAPTSCANTGGIGLASGDFNGDNKPDLVLADVLAAQIHIALNNGLGCFGAPADFPDLNEGRARDAAVADLNNDGKLDIVANTTVMIGNGSGGFTAPLAYGTGSGSEPGSNSVVADFNADGKLDIAAAGGGSLTILLGDGTGSLKYALGGAGRGSFGAALADVNSDGKLDVVSFTNSTVTVLPGMGTGDFGTRINSPVGAFVVSPVVADFNHDSKLDVAGLDSSNGPGGMKRLDVMFGDNAGNFAPPITTLFTASDPFVMGGGDFNGDTNFDLVILDRFGVTGMSLALGDGAGHFSSVTTFPLGVATNPKSIAVGDLNGDNKLDVAVPSGGSFTIMLGNGLGGFAPPVLFTTAKASSIVMADFNGDNKKDLAMVSEEQAGKLSIVLGDGAGGFGPANLFTVGAFPQDLTVGDFNNDGKIDVAVSNGRRSTDFADTLTTVSVLLGDGSGGMNARTDYLVEKTPQQILSGDFNNDLKQDLITANSNSNSLSMLLNTCGALVDPTTRIQFGSSLYSVGEGVQAATITVTRTGNTAGAASVRYVTTDGIASSRQDYITAIGTLQFAPGETVKSFNVLIIDDLRAGEASESFNVKLGSPVGAVLGNPDSAVVAIQENDPTITNVNPIDDATFFVRQHYFDFLNRQPDQTGLDFWVSEITQCESLPVADRPACREVKRVNVSAAFFLSIEFQETGYLVYRTYKTSFGDTTSPNVSGTVPIIRLNEFLENTQQIGQGVVVGQGNWQQLLENNKVAFMLNFVQQQRFIDAFPLNMTPAQFVDKLNTNAGQVLTQAQRDQLVVQLTNASDPVAGRAAALRQVSENSQLRANELNRAFVLAQYFGYLRRNPNEPQDTDYTGWKFWLDKLNQFSGNFVQAEMVKAFLSSAEYRNRFNSPNGF